MRENEQVFWWASHDGRPWELVAWNRKKERTDYVKVTVWEDGGQIHAEATAFRVMDASKKEMLMIDSVRHLHPGLRVRELPVAMPQENGGGGTGVVYMRENVPGDVSDDIVVTGPDRLRKVHAIALARMSVTARQMSAGYTRSIEHLDIAAHCSECKDGWVDLFTSRVRCEACS